MARQRNELLGQIGGTEWCELALPFLSRNRHFHASPHTGDFIRQIIGGNAAIDFFGAMRDAQSGLYHAQHVVHHQRQRIAQQRRTDSATVFL